MEIDELEETISALKFVRDTNCPKMDDFRKAFPLVADRVVKKLEANKSILFNTDGTIWFVRASDVNALINYYTAIMKKQQKSWHKIFTWKNAIKALEVIGIILGLILSIINLI